MHHCCSKVDISCFDLVKKAMLSTDIFLHNHALERPLTEESDKRIRKAVYTYLPCCLSEDKREECLSVIVAFMRDRFIFDNY